MGLKIEIPIEAHLCLPLFLFIHDMLHPIKCCHRKYVGLWYDGLMEVNSIFLLFIELSGNSNF